LLVSGNVQSEHGGAGRKCLNNDIIGTLTV